MRSPPEETLTYLDAIVAFLETPECAQMSLPMEVWRLARDYAITFHAFWTDEQTEVTSTREYICGVIMHTTPYKRCPTLPKACQELSDIMKYAKTSMPWVSDGGRGLLVMITLRTTR